MGRVDGKVAVVTGGSLGIGRAASILLAKHGSAVAVTDVLDKEGQALVEEIKRSKGKAQFWHLDVSKESEVEKVFAEVVQTFGKIDILVNNAGIAGTSKPTHEITEEQWDRVQAINVKGAFFCTKHAVPFMQKAGGGGQHKQTPLPLPDPQRPRRPP
ncbi:MAG: SDR family NAD(P)-dependent oxidoreductase, partial [Candidatus Zixiibacteriota bacterium]